VPRIDRPTIFADRVVVAAMLEALLPRLMTVAAQRLQLAAPEFDRIVVVRHDVIGDARHDDAAFAKTPFAQWLRAQLSACASVPKRFVSLGPINAQIAAGYALAAPLRGHFFDQRL
jgi:hypothetical protein